MTVKGWRQIRAERNSGRTSTWYCRHNKMTVPEYSLNVGWSQGGFFWLTFAFRSNRFVIDRYKKKGAA